MVTLADDTFGSAIIESSTDTDDDPLDGTLQIMPIGFIWHCLGEGSLISMADGSQKPIEKIIAGDTIKINNNGDSAIVEWTNKGTHIGDVLEIKTDNDNSIITTDKHIFISDTASIPAIELQVGQLLHTQEGVSKIVAIEVLSEFKGIMYNLATSTIQETKNGKIGTFIANGFHVGDINAQRAYRNAKKNDKDWIKKQIPEYLHQDVDSFFEDKLNN